MTGSADDLPVVFKNLHAVRPALTPVAAAEAEAEEVASLSARAVTTADAEVTLGHIARAWWPLTLSWLMMVAEGPLVAAMAARLPDPAVNLAALGGIVRALTFAIESPLLVLLTVSATLSKDWDSYRRLRKYTLWYIGVFTVIHIILSVTPAYYWVTGGLIGAPEEIIEPARVGMIITIPYLALVAYRRLNHGALIRFRYAYSIVIGTLIRLLLVLTMMFLGLALRSVSGVVLGALTMTAGVLIEAVFIEWRTRSVRRNELRAAPPPTQILTHARFVRFYIPLASTTVAMFLIHPVVSAALSRMPDPVLSLAVWSPVVGLAGMLGAGGGPIVDVMVTVLDRRGALAKVQRFTLLVCGATAMLAFALVVTPLGGLWFGNISALSDSLFTVARLSFWFILPYPIFLVFQSYYQGILTYKRRTNRITEAVFLQSLTMVGFLFIGTLWGKTRGIYVATTAQSVGMLLQTVWMRWRSKQWLHMLEAETKG